MTDIINAAVAASLLVGMMSIPAASQTVETPEIGNSSLEQISSDENIPVDETTRIDSDSFTRKVESPFSRFNTEIKSGKIEGELENPDTRLEVEETPEKTVWKLESSEGTLKVSQDGSSTTEHFKNPSGTLVREKEAGNIEENFEGSNRQEVEKAMEKMVKLLEERKAEYSQRAQESKLRHYRDGVEVEVQPYNDTEKVTIENTLDIRLSVNNWVITDDSSTEYKLEGALEPGQKLHVYTSEKSSIEDSVNENEEERYLYGSQVVWNDAGDTAELYDSSENLIATYNY